MRRLAFDPHAPATIANLKLGLNQLVYKIENLFFFLPCSFLVPVHADAEIGLGDGIEPVGVQHLEEHPGLDAVARDERQ